MTTDIAKCRSINQAVKRTHGDLTVTFNYRYNPVHEAVKRLIASGEIGHVLSVHFEWLLDTVHGADYFRRWHRSKSNSGGLMVHKSGHHFDLVNWWLAASPVEVVGMGRTAFYGAENGKRFGWAKDYERARGSEAAKEDPFAIHLEGDETLKGLYADAEKADGYHRDQNVSFLLIPFLYQQLTCMCRYSPKKSALKTTCLYSCATTAAQRCHITSPPTLPGKGTA